MPDSDSSANFANCLKIGEAAEFLGVSTATLRNWDRTGKLKPRRHPQNGYRIYLHEELVAILRSADLSSRDRFAPPVDWSRISDCEHFVQFYETDEFLIQSVSDFVGTALKAGAGSVVLATEVHRHALQRRLVLNGLDVADAIEAGRYVVLDAGDALAKFMVGGMPDPKRFRETVGGVIAQVAEGGRRVHAFGEMVALLWAEGNRDAAIRLEELWNELGQSYRFALFCAYPMANFVKLDDAFAFDGVCDCHSRVIPTESYAAIESVDERLRAITALQQKAQSLEAEIEHRHQVEQALLKRERELKEFFDNATEGLHKIGPDGTILWANKAECELLGYPPDEYVGQSISDFHADQHVIAEILSKLKRGETLHNFPARMRCKNGKIRHVLLSSSACFENGQFAYTRCFTRDVTQQWHAEQALRDADRRKDEFLAMLSHELRTPLAPIHNALEMLRRSRGSDELFAEGRNIIERQICQIARLVDDLLDVSRITGGKLELRKERVELNEVIHRAIESSRPHIDSARHHLTVTLPEKAVFLEADATRLAQVLSNLLNNAAKYTEPGGQIELTAEVDGQHAVVSAQDNGIGISCESLPYVFDMFRQADRPGEMSQGGLGIGLTLVRRLIELHGGSVNAHSEGIGKGSEFVVRLPLASCQTAPAAQPSTSGTALTKKRILVVDDNRDAGHTLTLLLRLDGHEVRMASDGLEALAATEEFSPDVILMDVGMPNLDGYEATRRIRQMPGGEHIFIIALTGWGQTKDREKSAAAGCSAHLVKPVEFATLQRLLASGKASD